MEVLHLFVAVLARLRLGVFCGGSLLLLEHEPLQEVLVDPSSGAAGDVVVVTAAGEAEVVLLARCVVLVQVRRRSYLAEILQISEVCDVRILRPRLLILVLLVFPFLGTGLVGAASLTPGTGGSPMLPRAASPVAPLSVLA